MSLKVKHSPVLFVQTPHGLTRCFCLQHQREDHQRWHCCGDEEQHKDGGCCSAKGCEWRQKGPQWPGDGCAAWRQWHYLTVQRPEGALWRHTGFHTQQLTSYVQDKIRNDNTKGKFQHWLYRMFTGYYKVSLKSLEGKKGAGKKKW